MFDKLLQEDTDYQEQLKNQLRLKEITPAIFFQKLQDNTKQFQTKLFDILENSKISHTPN